MQRVAVARLWHEGNSFTPVRTRLADFKAREWCRGAEVARFYRGTRTEIGAAVDFFERNRELTPIYLRCAAAPPGGPVDEADLQAVIAEIVHGVEEAKADAIYLSLHGALIGSETVQADLALIEAVRALLGRRRLAVSFDLHANLAPGIAHLADIAVGYKTHPHVDMYQTAEKALELLVRSSRPVVAIAKVGAVLPSFNMRTAEGPMAEIETLSARRARDARGVLDITPFGGFAYGDTPSAGASVSVTTEADRELAQALADEVAREMYRRRARFAVRLASPREALAAFRPGERPAAILEPSDNPLSGGVGDTTGLLRELLSLGKSWRTVFAFFWDPDLVSRLRTGERARVSLGGRFSTAWGPPVSLDAEVERVTEGRFRNCGPMEQGLEVNLGRTALLRAGASRIIVTSSCQAPNDPEYFRLHGVELAQVDLVCAKAKNHFRAAFAPQLASIVEVDTPGPASTDLASLPWRHVARKLIELGA
jgi:microcystin degradation protein MlrC